MKTENGVVKPDYDAIINSSKKDRSKIFGKYNEVVEIINACKIKSNGIEKFNQELLDKAVEFKQAGFDVDKIPKLIKSCVYTKKDKKRRIL